MERRRNAHAKDLGKEVMALTEELADQERRRGNIIDLAADGTITGDEARVKLGGLKARTDELENALERARSRDADNEAWRRKMHHLFVRFDQIRRDDLRYLAPESKRKILMASRTKVEIDREGHVRITGMIDLDVTKLLPTEGLYTIDPDRPQPPEFAGVVERGSTPP